MDGETHRGGLGTDSARVSDGPFRVLPFVLFVLGYTGLAYLGLRWATAAGAASPIWPAAGLAVAGVLMLGARYAPAIAIGLVAAAQLSGAAHPVWTQILMGIGNAAAALLAAFLIRRLARDRALRFSRLPDVLLLLVGAGAGAALSGLVGAGALLAAGIIGGAAFPGVFVTWASGDLVGILTLTALILSWSQAARHDWPIGRTLHFLAVLAATAAVSYEVFFGHGGARAWLIYPALAWAAIMGRVQGASAAIAVVSIVAVAGTMLGHGPFAPYGIESRDAVMLQQFMAVTAVTVLLLAAAVDERDSEAALRETLERARTAEDERARTSEELGRTHSILQLIGDSAATLIFAKDLDGRYLYLNEQVAGAIGRPINEMLGKTDLAWCEPSQAAIYMDNDRRIITTGRAEEIDEPVVQPDGSMKLYRSFKAPMRDDQGEIIGMAGIGYDVTDRKTAEEALRLRTAELETLLGNAPIGLAYFDREYRYLRINEELARINGIPVADHIGRAVQDIIPDNAKAVTPIIDRIFETGEPIREMEVTGTTPQQPGVTRYWLTGFFPVLASSGEVDSVGAWVVEITDRKAAEEREHLLSREVDHRAKNLLAVVQSIVQLTPGDDGPTLKASLTGRILALGRAHSLLSDARWDGVDLARLVHEELAPFVSSSDGAISFQGPSVTLRPAAAQSIGLVLHELATNAAKYGALSRPDGSLLVEWNYGGGKKGPLVEIVWTESGGPTPKEPSSTGFGSNIIRASVERQLRGKVTREWRPEGLRCTLRIPVTEMLGAAKG